MFGSVSEEIEVKVPASEAWKVYGTLKLTGIACESLPGLFSKFEILKGHGGVGTIVHLILTPGKPGETSYKEKFVVVDDEKRVKVAEVVEGGYLDMGFGSYRVRFEVIDKENGCCITRATIEYEVKEEENAALVSIQPLVAVMKVAANHLLQNYNNDTTTT